MWQQNFNDFYVATVTVVLFVLDAVSVILVSVYAWVGRLA